MEHVPGDPYMAVFGGRKRGRPRVEEPHTPVSTRITPSDHDRLIKLANQRDQTVSETVRQMLQKQLRIER